MGKSPSHGWGNKAGVEPEPEPLEIKAAYRRLPESKQSALGPAAGQRGLERSMVPCQLCSQDGREVAKKNMISLFPPDDGDGTAWEILPSSIRETPDSQSRRSLVIMAVTGGLC